MLQVDGGVATNAILARTLWLTGRAEAAYETARRALADARSGGHALSLCFALFGVCPVYLWAGDHAAAEQAIAQMRDEAARGELLYWLQWAHCYARCLALQQLDPDGARVSAAEAMRSMSLPHREMLATCQPGHADDVLLQRVLRGDGGWADAEILRCAGEQAWRDGDAARSGELLRRALATARAQGARAWEARSLQALARCGGAAGGELKSRAPGVQGGGCAGSG